MSGWRNVTLKEITTKIGSGATPRGGENSYKESGISLIRSQNVYDFEFSPDGLAFIDDKQAEKLSNVEIKTGDVLLNITGHSIGRCCLVPPEILPARVNQHVSIIRSNKEIDSRYLLYNLNNPLTKTALLNHAHGGTRKALTKGIIEDFSVSLPPLPTQRRIAQILGRLDDKIELNRRINRILEAMAQTLYKHHFVDFGPYQEGEFVESELGMIPKGWEVGTVEDVIELAYGKGLPKRKRNSGPYPVFGSSGQIDTHDYFLVEAPGIIVGRKGTIGSLYLARENFWPIDTTYFVVPKRKVYSLEFIYYLLDSLGLENRNNDSAVPGLNRNETYRLPLIIPPNDVLNQFHKRANLWFDQIEENNQQNRKLAEIRDYLLPRLLSGDIEV